MFSSRKKLLTDLPQRDVRLAAILPDEGTKENQTTEEERKKGRGPREGGAGTSLLNKIEGEWCASVEKQFSEI
jgi:hypothetical protein